MNDEDISSVISYLSNKYSDDRLIDVYFQQFAHEQYAIECIVNDLMESGDLLGSIIFYHNLIRTCSKDKKRMFYDILHVYIDAYMYLKRRS